VSKILRGAERWVFQRDPLEYATTFPTTVVFQTPHDQYGDSPGTMSPVWNRF